MSKSIYQLIPDIEGLLRDKSGWLGAESAQSMGEGLASNLLSRFGGKERDPSLRLSQMGPKCPRALWYSIHHPELDQPFRSGTEFMFTFGHVIESLALSLARAAGHSVEGEQDELCVDGIYGHRDAIVDGVLLDVKSTTTRGMGKFREGTLCEDDPFGYLDQLDGYLIGSLDDPLVKVKDRAYLLAIDKQLGNMCLYEHKFDRRREEALRSRISRYKSIVGKDTPPPCECGTEPEGSSGNVRLDLKASYSPQKFSCFPELRSFVYSKGPVYFTKVVKKPTYKGEPLKEIDRLGNPVY